MTNRSYNQTKYGVIMSYMAILINVIAALLYTPWMISKIGQGNYGLYTLSTSLITMFSIDFGLSTATTRFITKYLAEKKQEKINEFVGVVYKLYLVISALLLTVLFVLYFFLEKLYVGLTSEELETFKIIYVIISMYTVISFPFITLDGILSAYEEFVKLKLCDIFSKLFTIFLIVISLLFDKGVIELVLINAVVGFLVIIIKIIIVKKNIPIKVNFKLRSKKLLRDIFSFSAWVTVSQMFQRLIFNVTPSVLGMVSNSLAMSLFGAAMSLEGYAYTFSNAVGSMFLPRVSRIVNGENSQEELEKFSIKIGRIQYYIIGLIFVGFLTLGKDFIGLWLGDDFSPVYICAVLLIFPSLFHNSQKIQQMTTIAEGYVKMEAIAYLIMGTLNVVLSFSLSALWGAVGASISILVSYSVRTILLNCIYIKYLKMNMRRFYVEVYAKNLPLLFFTMLVGIILNYVLTTTSWINIIVKGIITVAVYVWFAWRFSFDSFEKSIVLDVMKKVKR